MKIKLPRSRAALIGILALLALLSASTEVRAQAPIGVMDKRSLQFQSVKNASKYGRRTAALHI